MELVNVRKIITIWSCKYEIRRNVGGKIHRNRPPTVAHLLGIEKSYWPHAILAPLASGIAVDYSEEDFLRYRDEAKPLAEEIIKSLES